MLNDGSPMTRGKLCVSAVRKSGKKAYNLQYRRNTVQFVKAIPADELDAYRRSMAEIRKEAQKARGRKDKRSRRKSG